MADLLGEKPRPDDTSTPVSHHTGKPANARPPAPPASAEIDRVKATYYLSPAAVDALEEGWHRLRKLVRAEDRNRVSKSVIVETALQFALRDLESKGPDSHLASTLVKQ
jgi:hypothetical protein